MGVTTCLGVGGKAPTLRRFFQLLSRNTFKHF